AICPVGPPKLMKPSFTQNRNASQNGTGPGFTFTTESRRSGEILFIFYSSVSPCLRAEKIDRVHLESMNRFPATGDHPALNRLKIGSQDPIRSPQDDQICG